jgi:recombination protein RecR
VEKESDINSIESIKKYKWIYFVLGGTISNLKKEDIKKLRIKELEERLKNPSKFQIPIDNFEEIILAINPTTEGEATILYLKRKLANFNIKISELGKGLPIGGELEYADEETLTSAFENRK